MEREKSRKQPSASRYADHSDRARLLPPLPGGEGRGEGERCVSTNNYRLTRAAVGRSNGAFAEALKSFQTTLPARTRCAQNGRGPFLHR